MTTASPSGSEELGRALGTDYLLIGESLTEAELDYLERTRRFVDDEVLPVIVDHWERADFPFALARRLASWG